MTRKKRWKRNGLIFIGLLGIIYIWQFELVNYGLMQLRGQFRVVNGSVPLEEFLADSTISENDRSKVKLILEIRDFAFNELGINYSDNYTSIFDQKGEPLMWVVSASDRFAFRAKRWKFPILGSFPYKGFFSKEKAQEEFDRIVAEEDLDVRLRTAGGWSTLGWFKDPVLSNMLRRSEGDLASLIIHELTHGTLFVKDSVTFNENLATFIGDKGAIMFMESKYGRVSPRVSGYKNELADEETWKDYILQGAQRLDSLYKEIVDLPTTEKQAAKDSLIADIRRKYNELQFYSPAYEGYFDRRKPNNAFFMSFLRYNSQQDELENELQSKFGGDLKAYLNYLKETHPSL